MKKQTNEVTRPLLGVILNGGKSSRMGQSKALLKRCEGDLFLDYAINRFDGICAQVVISVEKSSNINTGQNGIKIIPDSSQHIGLGPLSGISAALKYASSAGFKACFFTPVDLPLLKAFHLAAMADAWDADNGTTVCAYNKYRKIIEPLVSIIPTSAHDLADDAIRTGHLSVHRWLKDHNPYTVPIDGDNLQNINTPQDFDRMRADRKPNC